MFSFWSAFYHLIWKMPRAWEIVRQSLSWDGSHVLWRLWLLWGRRTPFLSTFQPPCIPFWALTTHFILTGVCGFYLYQWELICSHLASLSLFLYSLRSWLLPHKTAWSYYRLFNHLRCWNLSADPPFHFQGSPATLDLILPDPPFPLKSLLGVT